MFYALTHHLLFMEEKGTGGFSVAIIFLNKTKHALYWHSPLRKDTALIARSTLGNFCFRIFRSLGTLSGVNHKKKVTKLNGTAQRPIIKFNQFFPL